MKLPRLDRKTTVLMALLAAVALGDVWYGQNTWLRQGEATSLEENLATQRQSLRRLQTIAQLSAVKQELADLQKSAPAAIIQPLPSNVDTLKVIGDLLNTQSWGGKVVSFKARDPKTETIDKAPVLVLGYELTFQGNASELLGMLRRIDESKLVSLKVHTFGIERQQDIWSAKLDVTLYLSSSLPPTPTPGAKKG